MADCVTGDVCIVLCCSVEFSAGVLRLESFSWLTPGADAKSHCGSAVQCWFPDNGSRLSNAQDTSLHACTTCVDHVACLSNAMSLNLNFLQHPSGPVHSVCLV